MEININLKKEKENFYSITSNKPVFLVYGNSIKQVFTNLKDLFIKLEKLNQLNLKTEKNND